MDEYITIFFYELDKFVAKYFMGSYALFYIVLISAIYLIYYLLRRR